VSLLVTVVAFVVALGVLIVIHEYGHFIAARLCGVKVLRFSVGFGKPLWVRSAGRDRTEWVIAALPLGGYLKMLDEREGPVSQEELPRSFGRQSVWRRIAIVAAGPAANFALAVILYWLLFVNGVQEAKPIVAAPEAGTVAAASGLQRGETVLKINGEPVHSWQEVRWRLLRTAVERDVARLEVIDERRNISFRTLDLGGFDMQGLEGDPLARIGLKLYRPVVRPVIGRVVPGGVAERAGLRAGDEILTIERNPVRDWEQFVLAVRAHPAAPIVLGLRRGGQDVVIELAPEPVESRGTRIGRIGAAPKIDPQDQRDLLITIRYDPLTSARLALVRTWDTAAFSLRMLGKMVVGEISWKNLSGPVTIADYAGQSAQLGTSAYLSFLALISISLGVLNLLPIPLLDGGHLMYYMVEILKGSPVSERVVELGQRVGLTVLLFLMAFAFYNDINRLLSG